MLKIEYRLPPFSLQATPAAVNDPSTRGARQRCLRHYLVGSQEDTQHVIDRLYLLDYLDRLDWSHVIEIPENGIVIRPDPGDVLRYTERDRP